MGSIRIKICCIKDVAEARLAVERGASALGLVSAMPSGPGVISESAITEIAASAPPGVSTFLLTSLVDADAIIEQHRRCRTSVIQICDRLMSGTHDDIRRALPGVKLVQVVHVGGELSVGEALWQAKTADALLLDSGNQSLVVKELGGTGRTHDWDISARIAASANVPVFLAGGLKPENAAEAVAAVRPFGLDVCSGVRTDGRLDADKLSRFFAAVTKP